MHERNTISPTEPSELQLDRGHLLHILLALIALLVTLALLRVGLVQ